jgi:myo-inositol 2-dehydrogenase/D-chiro-inositol 1-dehydrogenase
VYGYDQRLEIFGTKGMVTAENNFPDNHRYFTEDGISSALPLNFFMDRYIEAYSNELKAFCNAIINNKPVPVGGEDGLISVAVGLAAKKSVAEGRAVKLSEIIG